MAIRLKAVGDIAPGDVAIDGIGVGSASKRHGLQYPFIKLDGVLDGSDLLLGNLEGSLSSRSLKENLRLCGLPGFARTLRDIGFSAVSVANNHVFDHGLEIFEETVLYCKEAGLKVCGLRGKDHYYCQPVIFEKQSVKIGLLAYTWIGLENDNIDEMGEYLPIVQDSVVNYTWNRDKTKDQEARAVVKEKNRKVIKDIQKLKREVDILVVMPHWGFEWSIFPPYGVTLEAKAIVDAGADLIIGSHTHSPQGIEIYNHSVIAYSLGNFLWDEIGDIFNFGMVLRCQISSEKVENYDYGFVKRENNFQPEPVTKNEFNKYNSLINKSTSSILSNNAEKILNDDNIYKNYEKQYNKIKLRTLMFFLKNLPRHPFLFKPLFNKFQTLLYIIYLRLKGKKVKW